MAINGHTVSLHVLVWVWRMGEDSQRWYHCRIWLSQWMVSRQSLWCHFLPCQYQWWWCLLFCLLLHLWNELLVEQVTRGCVVEQEGQTAAFFIYYHEQDRGPDDNYAYGISITYGSHRTCIWTHACGGFDNITLHSLLVYNCPSCHNGERTPPSLMGSNFYCESGAADVEDYNAYYFIDPLWDRSGCITSCCYDNPTQPWFYR